MKIKENLALRQVAGTWVVLPLANKVLEFDGMLTLNETGHMLWTLLEDGKTPEDMAVALTNEYEVSYEQAFADVSEFIEMLKKAGCVE